ncbi:MAG TPA: VWA domain-containing protein [Verrucomicrobiae bacterium]|nr:VWA domain-containing protein [Verrucomicrobiae bacterium]
MEKRSLLIFLLLTGFVSGSRAWMAAQESKPNFHVVVDMVQLNVAVTDNKGKYVTGLRPSDFTITEDKIPQKIATFAEGNEAPRVLSDIAAETDKPRPPDPRSAAPPGSPHDDLLGGSLVGRSPDGVESAIAGADVFILFDTSNYMYRGFAFAQDAIADFVRSLDGPDRVAFYSYSRDLFRASSLTPDRSQVLRGVRATTAGDDAALYNALLLTLKDAGQYKGRKVIVVFSNGPDNDSMVPPEDVGELAQSEGIPIYMISTRQAQLEPVSTAVFGRMSSATGGEAYFAKNWKDEQRAFAAIRDDLAHLYLLNYYPLPNPNRGWRAITVKLVGDNLKKYHIRTRSGYRPLPARVAAETTPAP